jgi:hypothetical protein
MRTAFTELVGVPHPIVGFNRSPGVVAAVSNADCERRIAEPAGLVS